MLQHAATHSGRFSIAMGDKITYNSNFDAKFGIRLSIDIESPNSPENLSLLAFQRYAY